MTEAHSSSRVLRNPYAAFTTKQDRKVLAMFKAGAVLHVWRNTCPHNWWLELEGKLCYEFPDFRYAAQCGLSGPIWHELRHLGKSFGASNDRVIYAGVFPDGLARSESWCFDLERVAVLEQPWEQAQAGQRASRPGRQRARAPEHLAS